MAEESTVNITEQTTQEQPTTQKTDTGNQAPGKEEKKAAAQQAEKTFTQADVDRIVQERLDRERKAQEEKQAEAAKLAAMNEKEKKDYEIKKLTARIAELEAKENRAAMAREARTMLSEKGLSDISDDIISRLIVESDAEATKQNVETFATMFGTAVDEAVKAKLKGSTPKTGQTSGSLTQAQILAVQDRKERQRLIRENMNLFQK